MSRSALTVYSLPVSSMPSEAPSGPMFTPTVALGPPPPPVVKLLLCLGARARSSQPAAARARGSPRSRAAVAALAIVSSRASPRAVALASSLEAPGPTLRISFGSDGSRLPRRLRNFDQSWTATFVTSLRGSPFFGRGNACLSGRQLTRLPTFTLTWRFLHFLGFFFALAAWSTGTVPKEAWAASGAAAGTASAAITASTITTRVRTRTSRSYARFAWLASLGYCLRRRDLDRPANSWRLV